MPPNATYFIPRGHAWIDDFGNVWIGPTSEHNYARLDGGGPDGVRWTWRRNARTASWQEIEFARAVGIVERFLREGMEDGN